jgi:hypothetical protein
MPRRKDIWRCGLIRKPAAELLQDGALAQAEAAWLDEGGEFTFLADPFGWRDETGFHLFAERYDYRTRHGAIDVFDFDAALKLAGRRPCLEEPWHLSYPAVFAGDGAVWMLPEAYRSGKLTLYRQVGGLTDWRAECTIALDTLSVDTTPLRYRGRWWLFYSPATTKATRFGHLHVAYADRLTGPWTPHPKNPVRIDRRSCRPGGTPLVLGDRIMLPTQDCSKTYGGAVRPLWITRLDETGFESEAGEPLPFPANAPPGTEGMHTFSACGDVTLVDVKRIDRSFRGLMLDLKRKLRRCGF